MALQTCMRARELPHIVHAHTQTELTAMAKATIIVSADAQTQTMAVIYKRAHPLPTMLPSPQQVSVAKHIPFKSPPKHIAQTQPASSCVGAQMLFSEAEHGVRQLRGLVDVDQGKQDNVSPSSGTGLGR